jgi:hypothetical protein
MEQAAAGSSSDAARAYDPISIWVRQARLHAEGLRRQAERMVAVLDSDSPYKGAELHADCALLSITIPLIDQALKELLRAEIQANAEETAASVVAAALDYFGAPVSDLAGSSNPEQSAG